MKKLRANRAKPVVLGPVWPNVGVQTWYQNQLDTLISQASGDLVRELATAWHRTPPLFSGFAQDAAPEASAAGIIFRAPTGRILFVRQPKRGWEWPGGKVDENETTEAAARREGFEETLQPINGPLEFFDTLHSGGVYFAAYVYDVLEEFTPQLGVEHDAFVWASVSDARAFDKTHPGIVGALDGLEALGMDAAPTGTKGLQAALAKWGSQMVKRFDLMAKKIADDFAARNAQATQSAVLAQLKKAGFTVKFVPTAKSIEAYRAVAAENIALIKSIPRKMHEQVEQKVWNAIRQGSDLHKLSTELHTVHGSTVKRAALIARDQNAKAKATIERVRQMELGITRAVWMHSHAGKEPRPTHVAMNDHEYELAKGMYDSDEGEWVHPGQLINCRCTNRPVIEGFE